MTILLSALKFYTTVVKIAISAYKKYLTSNGLDFDADRYYMQHTLFCFKRSHFANQSFQHRNF